MKARVFRRRDDGAVLGAPVPAVEGASLLEVFVVDATEQGARRPIKVARLQPIGEQRILAQLKIPRLVQLRGWSMVLSGIEEVRDQCQGIRGVAQTWMCELWVPENAAGFRVADTYQRGVRIPGSALRERTGSRGKLLIGAEHSNALQRHTTVAELQHHQIQTFPAGRLVDCYIEFMGEHSFELGGLRVREAHDGEPQRLERNGWLCEVDLHVPEFSKREARRLR
jgi:hypothetical protein